MTAECVCCGKPTADGYACSGCAAQAAQKLASIADLAPEARAVAYGAVRRSEGGSSGKPGSRSPGNDDALDALTAVQGTLTTWVRHILEERGGQAQRVGDDPIVHAAWYLQTSVEWLRHRQEVDEAFRDFADCARRLRRIVEGPAPRRYLGPCGAEITVEDAYDDFMLETDHCQGDVYGPTGGKTGTCRTCGAQVDQGERRAWLDDQVRGQAFRAAHIADAYGINVNTIRTWAHERPAMYDHSGAVVRPARPAKLRAHAYDREGRPLFLVGDVLDLAAEAAARRAENEAKRSRRQETAA